MVYKWLQVFEYFAHGMSHRCALYTRHLACVLAGHEVCTEQEVEARRLSSKD